MTRFPFQKDHGNPGSTERHVGDLGNVLTHSDRYSTNVFIYDRMITLEGSNSIDQIWLQFWLESFRILGLSKLPIFFNVGQDRYRESQLSSQNSNAKTTAKILY